MDKYLNCPEKKWELTKQEGGKHYKATFYYHNSPNELTDETELNWEEYTPDVTPVIEVENEVPTQVTMRQARLALHAAGLLAGINTAIEQMGEAAKIEWEYAPYVQRDNPLIAMVQQDSGLSDAQIDDLFLLASTL